MSVTRFAENLDGGATVAALGTFPVAVIGPPPAHWKQGLSKSKSDTTE